MPEFIHINDEIIIAISEIKRVMKDDAKLIVVSVHMPRVDKEREKSDWEERAGFLASLAKEDTLPLHLRESVCQAILNLVSAKT